MNADFKNQITKVVNQVMRNKVFPSCVIGIVNKNGERQVMPFGNFTYDLLSQSVQEDTIYDTASITKSIPTASLAVHLIDEGRLKLTDKLIDYIPEFRNADREKIVIKHLLTHTIDGYSISSIVRKIGGKSMQNVNASNLLDLLFTRNFEKRPGTIFKYTNIPALLLAMIIEKITGDTIDNLADEYFFKPLKMTRTTFYPEKFPLNEIAPTEHNDGRGLIHGVVHDESAYIFKREGKIVGHAGLFSTVPDILNFLEMLLCKGTYQKRRYFSENIIKQMSTNQISEHDNSTGLGWELNQPHFMGDYCTPHTFGKTGFTGTLCVCDIEKGIAYVILSNRIFPKRPINSVTINSFRKSVGEIILKS